MCLGGALLPRGFRPQNPVFVEIEQMLRRYRILQLRLAALQPRFVTAEGYFALSRRTSVRRPVESLAVERAEISTQIGRIRLILRALTKDERRFIDLRYFQGLPMWLVGNEMHWSQAQLYRLRTSVLAKAAWILGLSHEMGNTFERPNAG